MDSIPPTLIEVADSLGIELYAVGGSVRDPLLGRKVGDIDLAVVGDAQLLAETFARRIDAGQVIVYARFGTALVKTDYRSFEFATARKESYAPESRKPVEVTPVPIELDLQRRDFTVNAIALALSGSRRGEILDFFDGLRDLREKTLRTPADPDTTFSDDPLRMVRAIRFSAELDFVIDPIAWERIIANADRLRIVASERIGEEFHKMLAGSNPVKAMDLLIQSGLMDIIIPEVTAMGGVEQVGRHHHKDVLKHSLQVMQNVVDRSPDPIVRLAGLLHDVGKPRTKRFDPEVGWTFHGHEALGAKMTQRIARRLQMGKESMTRLCKLVQLHMRPVNLTAEAVTDSAVRRLMVEAGDVLDDQLVLCRADITTANPKLVEKYLANFEEMEMRMLDVNARDRLRNFQSPIRGEEIIEICGITAGPLVGALKGRIEDAILDGLIPYDRSAALEYLLSIKDEVLNIPSDQIHAEGRERSHSRKNANRNFNFPEQ